jgi:GNAT superfamily N-acetyltransferase
MALAAGFAVLMSDMNSSLVNVERTEARQTPQRGCRPLLGLAAAAEEKQRKTALGACHVVTVTPHGGCGLSVISKIAWRKSGHLRHSGLMPFVRVQPDDMAQVTVVANLEEAARQVDDPDDFPPIPEMLAGDLRYGWDLEPEERYLYASDDVPAEPVGVLALDMPARDNLHLVWAHIVVHPDHRRRGHGSAIMDEALRRTREAGRNTVWVGGAEDDQVARKFLEGFGFSYASHDARRRQVLADVDQAEVQRLWRVAQEKAADYCLERLRPPTADEVLGELVEVTAAINDAPMGDLTYEDEKFDLQRLRDFETALVGRGERAYRVIARHRQTGEVGGHTVVAAHPLRPEIAGQGDTAVARQHRGHRLGLLLKIDMMHWLAEAEPQLKIIQTWNNAENRFMINVNEALGYRLSRVFNMYELRL